MKKTICISLTVLLSAILPGSVSAQNLPFMNYNETVRTLSTGGASGTNGALGSLYDGKGAFGIGFVPAIGSGSGDAILRAGGFGKIGKFSAGAGATVNFQKPYEMYSAAGAPQGTFNPMEWNATLCASFRILPFLSVGVAGRMISSKLSPEAKANGFTADISILLKKEVFTVGLSAGNLGTGMDYGNGKVLPPSYAGVDASFFKGGFKALAGASYYFAGSFSGSIGVQYGVKDVFFVRGGYHYANGTNVLSSFCSGGLGVKFVGINLDVSYLYFPSGKKSALGFGLGYSF